MNFDLTTILAIVFGGMTISYLISNKDKYIKKAPSPKEDVEKGEMIKRFSLVDEAGIPIFADKSEWKNYNGTLFDPGEDYKEDETPMFTLDEITLAQQSIDAMDQYVVDLKTLTINKNVAIMRETGKTVKEINIENRDEEVKTKLIEKFHKTVNEKPVQKVELSLEDRLDGDMSGFKVDNDKEEDIIDFMDLSNFKLDEMKMAPREEFLTDVVPEIVSGQPELDSVMGSGGNPSRAQIQEKQEDDALRKIQNESSFRNDGPSINDEKGTAENGSTNFSGIAAEPEEPNPEQVPEKALESIPEQASAPIAVMTENENKTKQPRILIVDSSKFNSGKTKTEAQSIGMEADVSNSTQDALMKLESGKYDFVFCEFKSSSVDAKEIFHKLDHESRKGFVTVTSTQAAIDNMKSAGCDLFLAKPLTSEKLSQVIKKTDN